MLLEPKDKFRTVLFYADLVNPYIILLSIIGLILEYTPLKEYFVLVNQIFDLIFVADFLIRSVSFRFNNYFMKHYGWVDFLAALPGFLLLFESTGILALIKVVRIGKFFKIVRILRILRVFSFLKKMRSESTYIQSRLMKIGVSITLILIVTIGIVDYVNMNNLVSNRITEINTLQKNTNSVIPPLACIFAIKQNDKFNKVAIVDGKILIGQSLTDEELFKYNHDLHYSDIKTENNNEFIIAIHDLVIQHDQIMFVLILGLVILLSVILFYVGFIFAKDMRIVHLIIDSADADDYMLLKEEIETIEKDNLEIIHGEDEIDSLLKMCGKLALRQENLIEKEVELDARQNEMDQQAINIENIVRETLEASLSSSLGTMDTGLSGYNEQLSEDMIKQIAKEASLETLKQSTKAIIDYINKNLKK